MREEFYDEEKEVLAESKADFLEKYGFKVINISSENNITSSIKNKFKNKKKKRGAGCLR